MKKLVCLILTVLLSLSCVLSSTVSVNAIVEDDSGDCGTNATYYFDADSGTLSIKGTGAMRNYTYTSTPWYDYYTSVKHIVIENGITTIGNFAFHGLWNLESVEIADSVKIIGESAFFFCIDIKAIELPMGVTDIGGSAFASCESLCEFVIPESVTKIGGQAFSKCANLESIIIPDSVETLDFYCFNECTGLKSITIPATVKYLGHSVFSGCSALNEVIISDGIKKIPDWTFQYCYDLENIIIPASVTSIERKVFYSCDKLTEIYIMNPKCNIYDNEDTIFNGATIYGYSGSTADEYAQKYGRKFVRLECTHLWDDGVVSRQPTCILEGEYLYTCSVCNETKSEKIDKTEHNKYTTNVTFEDYFTNGYTGDLACIDCGELFEKGKTIPKLRLSVPAVKINSTKRKIVVKYNKVENATGFQVKYSYKKTNKINSYNTSRNSKVALKKLKSGVYKVRVRAFINTNNKTAYSKWTKAQKIKIK